MTDFSKVTGSNGAETTLNYMRVKSQAQAQEILRLNNELAMRAMPVLSNFTDAIRFMATQAQAGNPAAIQQLQLLRGSLDLVDEVLNAKSKIMIPK